MWLLRNWVESQSRPIGEKTPCSKKSGSLTSTNLDFDFEIGNSDLAVKHEIQKRLSTLRNPSSKWISNKKFSSRSHGFICFAFFWEIQKGSLLGGVSMRLTVGYKKKKNSFGFFLIHLEDRIFSVEIRFCFSFFITKSEIWIYQSKAPRTLEPFSRYSSSIRTYFGLFWIEIRLFL